MQCILLYNMYIQRDLFYLETVGRLLKYTFQFFYLLRRTEGQLSLMPLLPSRSDAKFQSAPRKMINSALVNTYLSPGSTTPCQCAKCVSTSAHAQHLNVTDIKCAATTRP